MNPPTDPKYVVTDRLDGPVEQHRLYGLYVIRWGWTAEVKDRNTIIYHPPRAKAPEKQLPSGIETLIHTSQAPNSTFLRPTFFENPILYLSNKLLIPEGSSVSDLLHIARQDIHELARHYARRARDILNKFAIQARQLYNHRIRHYYGRR